MRVLFISDFLPPPGRPLCGFSEKVISTTIIFSVNAFSRAVPSTYFFQKKEAYQKEHVISLDLDTF